MKMHVILVSPTSRKVMAVASHMDLAIEYQVLPSFSSATLRPEYIALNPHGKVPVLEDDGLVLAESCAILKYLTDKYPDSDLVPGNIQDQAIMWSWIFWEAAHFTQAVSGYFWQSFVKPHYGLGTPDEDAMAVALASINQLAPAFEARLEGRRFVMGDSVTLADYAIGGISDHQRRGRQPWDDFPNIKQYFARLETLPAMIATLPPFDDEKR